MTNSSNIPEKNFVDSIAKNELKDISSDMSEALLDTYLSDGFFKEMPFIGTAFKTFSVFQKTQEYFFAKKIYKFLFELKNIEEKEREDFKAKIDKDNNAQKMGEKVLLLLNQSDDIDKATIIGRLFKAYIEKRFDFETFQRATAAINKVFIGDIRHILSYNIDSVHRESLVNAGFLTLDGVHEINHGGNGKLKYTVSQIGNIVQRYGGIYE
jgi:hypothetical protein